MRGRPARACLCAEVQRRSGPTVPQSLDRVRGQAGRLGDLLGREIQGQHPTRRGGDALVPPQNDALVQNRLGLVLQNLSSHDGLHSFPDPVTASGDVLQNLPRHLLERVPGVFRQPPAFAQRLQTVLDPLVLRQQAPQGSLIPLVLRETTLVREDPEGDEEQQTLGEELVRGVALRLHHGDAVVDGFVPRQLDADGHDVRRGGTVPEVQDGRAGKTHCEHIVPDLSRVQGDLRVVLEHADEHGTVGGALALDVVPSGLPPLFAYGETRVRDALLLLPALAVDEVFVGVELHGLLSGVGLVKKLVYDGDDEAGAVVEQSSKHVVVRCVDGHPDSSPSPSPSPL